MVSKYSGPEPKTFQIGKGQLFNVLTASLTGLLRLGSGGFAKGYSVRLPPANKDGRYAIMEVGGRQVKEISAVDTFKRPVKPIDIYEMEGCPFCRKVREAVNILSLDVTIHPCPKGGTVWRAKLKELGGKEMVPYMVDHNTGTSMYESGAIVKYLFDTWGDGKVPLGLRLGILTDLSCALALLPRLGAGNKAVPSKQPKEPLVAWLYEFSPFCKVVREALSELELPYKHISVPRGSPARDHMVDRFGLFQAPLLEDPNTGKAMFESGDIVKYLHATYGA